MSARWWGALALDAALAEPPAAVHPVVLMGRAIGWLERRAPSRGELLYGVALVAAPAAGAAAIGELAQRVRLAPVRILAVLFLLKSTFALRALVAAAARVERAVAADDLPGARSALAVLVGRPAAELDPPRIASAAIESLAENLADSYVAPLFWYALGGPSAALAYRAVNTADAMVGYRGRYELLGKAAARLDDLASYVPSRLAALALVAAAPLAGANARDALATLLRDGGRTESPNAGRPIAAAAGALGIWLEKPGHYRLGTGRAPRRTDIARAGRLIAAGAIVATVTILGARGALRG